MTRPDLDAARAEGEEALAQRGKQTLYREAYLMELALRSLLAATEGLHYEGDGCPTAPAPSSPPPPASEAEPWGSRRSECNCRTGDGPGLHDDGCNVTLPPEPPETKAPRARRNRSRDEDRNETAEGS